MVTDNHTADLRHFYPIPFVIGKPKSITTNDSARVNFTVASNNNIMTMRHITVYFGISTNFNTVFNNGRWPNKYTLFNNNPFTNTYICPDQNVICDFSTFIDNC